MEPSADKPLRSRLKDHYHDLVSELMPQYYIDFLFAKRVFSLPDKQELERMQLNETQIAQSKHFVDILMKKPESAVETFLQYLKTASDKQPHIYFDILFPEEKLSAQTGRPERRQRSPAPSTGEPGVVPRQKPHEVVQNRRESRGEERLTMVPFPIQLSSTRQEDISAKANVHPTQTHLPTTTETDIYRDDSYPMTKKPSGLALIINNKHFDSKCCKKPREGTDVDAANLKQVFTYLGFITEVLHDQDTDQMLCNLRKLAQYDHRNYDCVVICILTHGTQGKLYGSNGDLIEVQKLITLFNGDQAPSLVGKPKLFFLQACRGDNYDYGQDESDGPPMEDPVIQKALGEGEDETDDKMRVPVEADMLLAYSTVPGYVSWRKKERGSWFIQALTEVLVDDSSKDDITHMMLTVNRKVATKFETERQRCRQMPSPVVQLLKKLYFHPGQ